MPKQWRCAVVGVSVVGKIHVKVLDQLPNTTLAACCDLLPDRAEKILAEQGVSGVPVYKDLGEMLAKEKLDVIHLATPSGLHMDPSIQAMQAGVSVIVEKPIEILVDRIDRMNEVAKKHGVKLAYISQTRWKDENLAIRRAVDEKRFGTVAWAGCFTPWFRTNEYYEQGGWRGTWKLDGGGAVMNQSVHAVDVLQWLAGPVKRVSAYAASRIHPKIEVEDTLSAALQFENGSFGTIMGSTAMYPGGPVRIEIGGENGTAVSENGLKTFAFRDERPGDKETVRRANESASKMVMGSSDPRNIPWELHAANITDILGAWERGQEAQTSGAEGRKAVAIITAMYESAKKNGAPVDVK